jgi:hypothetical protein
MLRTKGMKKQKITMKMKVMRRTDGDEDKQDHEEEYD